MTMTRSGRGATILPRLGLSDPGDGTAVADSVDPPMPRRIHAVWCETASDGSLRSLPPDEVVEVRRLDLSAGEP